MNKKVITPIAVVVVIVLVVLGVIYAPGLIEFLFSMHQIPPH